MDGNLNVTELFIPEETFIEILIRYGLYFAAAFQIFCLASIFLKSPSDANNSDEFEEVSQEKKIGEKTFYNYVSFVFSKNLRRRTFAN